MPATPFTTRLDVGLKARLQRVAEYDCRSASFVANRAIQSFVEEREATRALVEIGLELAKEGISISDEAITAWMNGPEDMPFPKPDTFE